MTKGYKPQYTPYYFQLEKRIVFDGAAVETLAETVNDAAAEESVQQDIQESIANDTETKALEEAVEVFLQNLPTADGQQSTEKDLTAAERLTENQQSISSVLFVDSAVQDYEQLIQGVDKNMAVVILKSNLDGVHQIADALGSYSNLDSIQILSHGGEGKVSLGNTSLNNSTIDTYAEQLKIWGNSLSPDGDILLFGCYVAANEGSTFVNRLADITDADIAASEDLTGNALLGGDWDLEKATGAIEAALFNNFATLASYKETLAIDLTGSTANWDIVLKGNKFDYSDDQQAPAADLDLVGSKDDALLYIKFDEKNAGTDDDELGFRVRLNGSDAANSSAFTSGFVFLGVDSDLDGALEFFISVSKKNNSGIEVWSPGTGANTSPSTTSITDGVEILSEDSFDATNFSFIPVDGTTDPNATFNDLNTNTNVTLGNGTYDEVDHFLSFKFSFATLVSKLADKGITITKDTSLQFTLATSTQSNAFNSDIGGYSKTDDTSITYKDKGAFSTVTSFSNMPPEITSNGGGDTASINVVTGNTAVTDVNASDPNTSDTLTYSISGGADSSKFSINSSTGVLTFKTAPDVNSPTDSDSNNTYVVEVKASDGNGGTDTQILTVNVISSADTSNPTLTSSNPADNATGVSLNANISLTFNESVQGGTGNIYIKKGSTTVETIDIGSDQVSFSGDTLTINPAFDLTASTAYNIQVDSTAIVDFSNNAYAGISDQTTLNFTTGTTSDTTPPTLTSSNPADDATGVSTTGNIVLTFNENISPNTGNIVISDGSSDTRTISITDGTQITISGKTITINPTSDLSASTGYHIKIDSTAVQDTTGNLYAGINDTTTLNFTTAAANSAPTISSLNSDTLAYTEGDGAKVIDQGTAASVADSDSTNFDSGKLTVAISANRVSGEDKLAIKNTGTGTGQIGVNGSNVTYEGTTIGTFTGGTGTDNLVITFDSDATPTAVTALVKNITYENTNTNNPTASSRTVGFTVTDGDGGTSATSNATVTVSAVNDIPTISNLNSDTLAYTEGDGAKVIDQGTAAVVADVDSTDFNTGTLTVAISANRVSGEDKLAIKNTGTGTGQIGVDGSNVTYEGTTIGTFTGGTGTDNLVITFNSNATPTAVTALVKNITYENTNTNNPTASSRTLGFTVTDGDGGT